MGVVGIVLYISMSTREDGIHLCFSPFFSLFVVVVRADR